MINKELKKHHEDGESLSPEHQRLCKMCKDLKRIAAPKDFDFRLKSRIANCDRSEFERNPLLPFLRYALPLGVVLLLAGFIVFSGILTENRNADAVIAEIEQPVAPPAAPVDSQTIVAENPPPASVSNAALVIANAEPQKTVSGEQIASAANKTAPAANTSGKNAAPSKDFGGTVESTTRDTPVIMPSGIPNKQSSAANNSPNESNRGISIKSYLEALGIEATFVKSGWSVKSVTADSPANRAGIKAGDLIESTESRRLDSESIFEQSFTIRTLNINRGGKKMTVALR